MRALSLWEPWASAMAFAIKRNETRSWSTNYRGPLVICASLRPMTRDLLALYEMLVEPHAPKGYVIPYGKAVCLVDLVDVRRTEHVVCESLEESLGDYTAGRFAWITANLRALHEPVPVSGHQGLFRLLGADEKAIRDQVATIRPR